VYLSLRHSHTKIQETPPVLGFLIPSPSFVSSFRRKAIDEDITTPTVMAYNSKVKLFFNIIIFNICDEWTLHHDMYSMSFTEVLIWIKEGVDHAWK
jgi:hypothetical protein